MVALFYNVVARGVKSLYVKGNRVGGRRDSGFSSQGLMNIHPGIACRSNRKPVWHVRGIIHQTANACRTRTMVRVQMAQRQGRHAGLSSSRTRSSDTRH